MDVFDWRKRLLGLPYPDAEQSVGMFYRKMGLESCWEVVGPARAEFEQIAKEIKEFLEKNFEPTSTPVLWTMYMIGRSVTTARPTILFCSKEADCRKAVRKVTEKSGILKKFPAVRVGDADRPPDFDCLVPLALCEKCDLVPNSQSITPVPSITSYQLPTLSSSDRTFRLLEILPEKNGTTIECLLRTVSIGASLQYIVISGKFTNHSSFNTSLIINGVMCEAPLNVVSILELLWSRAFILRVWIDQLCVDHHNLKERQDQINILPRIKNYATSILLPSEIYPDREPDALVYREKANLINYVFTCRYDQDCFTLWKATAGGIFCLKNKKYLTTVSHGFADASGTVRDAPIRMAQPDISMKDVLDNEDSELEYNIQEWPGSDSDEGRSMNLTSGARLTRKSLIFDFNDEQSMNKPGVPSLSTSDILPSTRFSFPTKAIEFGSEVGSCITEKGSFTNSGSFTGEEGSLNRFRGESALPQDQSLFYPGFLSEKITQYEKDQSDHIDTFFATWKAYYEESRPEMTHQAIDLTQVHRNSQAQMLERIKYLGFNSSGYLDQDVSDPSQTQLAPIGKVVTPKSADPSLDYALIELDSSISSSVIQPNSRNVLEAIVSRAKKVLTAPIDTSIYAVTGSAGVIKGHLSGTPIFMQLPGIKATQELWKVSLPLGLQPGDSGSMVVNAENGNVLGHIVSGSPQGTACIIPIYKILNDIRERLHINPSFTLLNPEQPLLRDEGESYSFDRFSGYTLSTATESSDKSLEIAQ